MRAEVLRGHKTARAAEPMLSALVNVLRKEGVEVSETTRYVGNGDWLILFGVGAPEHNVARNAQVLSGRHALLWDLGYMGGATRGSYLRMSIDTDHPQWLDQTSMDPSRFDSLGLELREDSDPEGPIVLIGLGLKARAYLKLEGWEQSALRSIRERFPRRRVIFRPKGHDRLQLNCETDSTSTIEEILRGAALVICRHSNVGIDATIAGVPFEAHAGAARWLAGKPFTAGNRLNLLRRAAWWQWKSSEAEGAWRFARQILQSASNA